MAEPWIGPRQEKWTDYLPDSWQTAINTNPVVNALARYVNRPSFEEGVKAWQDSIPGNSPIDRIADRKSTVAQEYPKPMGPWANEALNTTSFLANFIGPGAPKMPTPAAPKPQGIKAYHGSPHDFDRFDISKIGTGEGAQAYGRGLYFAENEEVARAYKNVLGARSANPQRTLSYDPDTIALAAINHEITFNGRTPTEAAKIAADKLKYGVEYYRKNKPDDWYISKGFDDYQRMADAHQQAIERIRSGELKTPGHMYEVRINADPEQFLDWDKPLSQQPEAVRKTIEPALKKAAEDLGQGASPDVIARFENMGLGNIAARMRPKEVDPWSIDVGTLAKEYPNALRDAGIPGIRYKDAMSRDGAGPGTSNYVVFDDALIEILRKYGLIPPVAAGAAQALTQGQDTAN